MPQYFLCYRRDDTAGHTGRLYSDLARELGEEEVFFDLRSIPPGMDHREATKQAIGSSSVVLVVIGRAWRPELLPNESDYVRPELETALAGGKRVVPVLVQGTPMPAADELPESVRSFAYLNAAEMSDRHWDADVAALVRLLRPRRTWSKSAVVGALLIVGAGFAAWAGWRAVHNVATTSETAPPPTTSAATTAGQRDSVASLKVRPNSRITVRVAGTPNVDRYTLAVLAGDPVRVVDAPKERPQVIFVAKEQKTEVVLSAVTSRPAAMTIDVYIGSKWRRTYPLLLPAGVSTKHWVFERLEESATATDTGSSTTAGTSTTSAAYHGGTVHIFEARLGRPVRIRADIVKPADVNVTTRLSCGGKPVRSWTQADIVAGIEFRMTENCTLELTAVAFAPAEVRFTIDGAGQSQTLPFHLDETASPVALKWMFIV
jgi:hypothetical protein